MIKQKIANTSPLFQIRKNSWSNYSWLFELFDCFTSIVIICNYKRTAHLISSSWLGPAAKVQLLDHDAQCISVRICFSQGCMACPGTFDVCGDCDMLGTTRIRICSVGIWKKGTAGWTRCDSFAFSSKRDYLIVPLAGWIVWRCVRLHSGRDSRKIRRREHKIWRHILADHASEILSPISHTAWALE